MEMNNEWQLNSPLYIQYTYSSELSVDQSTFEAVPSYFVCSLYPRILAMRWIFSLENKNKLHRPRSSKYG